ncbi:hypothetical protein G6F58_013604 [Rhizopus delemar]|nr:hypothetical protein G6F58_013604 [Rhizopus delemar]
MRQRLQRFHPALRHYHPRFQRRQQLPQQRGVVQQRGTVQIAPLRRAHPAYGDHERGAAHRRVAHAQQ